MIGWLYVRAMVFAVGLALGAALVTGAAVLVAARRLPDLTGHRTTIVLPAAGERFYWASLSTGLGIWSSIAWLVA
jgi:hypothetical protein